MPNRIRLLPIGTAISMVAACLSSGAMGAAQATRRPMTLVDLLNIPRIDDPQISRDGKRVAFQLRTTDWPGNRRVPQIWLINADGTGLAPLTEGDAGASSPRWSPDGASIAFLSRGQISLSEPGGKTRPLSQHATPVADLSWHPDGKSIYFVATDRPSDADRERQRVRGDIRVLDEYRHRHLWRIGVQDGKEERITSGDFSIYAYKLAPDGKRIIVSRRPTPLPADADRMELWNIGADGRGGVQLTSNRIAEVEGEASPDGSQVLFIARANHRQEPYYNANLFLVHASGGTVRALMPDFPYEVQRAAWAADGRSIWMVVNMGIHSEIFQVDVASAKHRQITTGQHSIVEPYWNVVSDRHVFVIDQPERIGDVWTWAPGSMAPRRITSLYDYLERDFLLPRQEKVEWKSVDGTTIEGVLTYPLVYQAGTRYPLVVQLHGGPEASDRFGWGSIFFYYQPAWAAQGYAILRPNYRGSSGYGNAFYREPVGGYFKHSHHDVIAGVDRLIAMGVADPDRLAMMGWSAGGHLVNKLITVTTRFKAAASGAGVANWISLYGVSDTRADRDLWLGGTLWQKTAPIDTYWEHSPLKYVTAARTPTLFFIGENDPRVPMSQAVEMSRALRAQGVATDLMIAPNEGHDWTQPVHQLAKMNLEMEWFARYVRGLPYTPETAPAKNDAGVVPHR
jgi:dipeptidyl aminopeptidase/acylaminoacyl peptidase